MASTDGPETGKGWARAREIADRLDRLIKAEDERRAAKGEPAITYREIARMTGNEVSHTTVRSLHLAENGRGAPVNPQVGTLDAIGKVFGIRNGAEYFTSEEKAEAVEAQLKALQDLAQIRRPGSAPGDAGLGLAFRVAQLNPDSYELVNDLAGRLLAFELQARQDAAAPSEQDV